MLKAFTVSLSLSKASAFTNDSPEWIVDTHSLKLPPRADSLGIPGMILTSNLPAYVERKLFTLNCGHAIAAYLGYLLGLPTIDAAINNTTHILPVVLGAMHESGAAIRRQYPDTFSESEHEEYIDKTIQRFRNPEVRDDVTRVGRNPLRKLGRDERLLGPLYLGKQFGLDTKNLAMGVAATMMYQNDEDEQASEISSIIERAGLEEAVQEITGLEKGSKQWEEVMSAWGVLERWKKEHKGNKE